MRIRTVMAGFGLVVSAPVGPPPPPVVERVPDEPAWALPPWAQPGDHSHEPCVTEDGPWPCFWNADSRGNQTGRDFHLDSRGWVYYPFRDVADHDACWLHIGDDISYVWCEDGWTDAS